MFQHPNNPPGYATENSKRSRSRRVNESMKARQHSLSRDRGAIVYTPRHLGNARRACLHVAPKRAMSMASSGSCRHIHGFASETAERKASNTAEQRETGLAHRRYCVQDVQLNSKFIQHVLY